MSDQPWLTRRPIPVKVKESIVPECTGACCEAFSIDPKEMTHTEAMAWLSRPGLTPDAQREFDFIRDMVIPLTGENEPHLFTCRHYDTTTHLCTVYDERPLMCRAFPRKGLDTCSCQGLTG